MIKNPARRVDSAEYRRKMKAAAHLIHDSGAEGPEDVRDLVDVVNEWKSRAETLWRLLDEIGQLSNEDEVGDGEFRWRARHVAQFRHDTLSNIGENLVVSHGNEGP